MLVAEFIWGAVLLTFVMALLLLALAT